MESEETTNCNTVFVLRGSIGCSVYVTWVSLIILKDTLRISIECVDDKIDFVVVVTVYDSPCEFVNCVCVRYMCEVLFFELKAPCVNFVVRKYCIF